MRAKQSFAWTLIVLGLVVVGGMLVLRIRSQQAGSALSEASRHTSVDAAWLAALPEVDPALRKQAWVWMKSKWPTHGGSSLKDEDWYLRGKAAPVKLLERHELERAHVAELTALLRADVSCLSSAAWARQDLAASDASYGPKHIPNLLSCRGAMRWYGIETMLADDPLPALDLVDRLHEALAPCGSLIDHMIRVSLASDRDLIHVRLSMRSALPAERLAAWLAEEPDGRRSLLDAYRADRLLLWEPLARDLLSGDPRVKKALYGKDLGLFEELDYRWHAKRDVACIIGALHLYERHLADEVDASALAVIDDWKADGGQTLDMGLLSHEGMVWNVISVRAQHRMMRTLVRIARDAATLPASEADIRVRLPHASASLDPGPWDLRVRYQRVKPDRLRLYVPRDTPLPPLLEDGRDRHLHVSDEPTDWSGFEPLLSARHGDLEMARLR